jgi:hypothetical protein
MCFPFPVTPLFFASNQLQEWMSPYELPLRGQEH